MDILHVSTTHDWRGGQIQMFTTYQLMEDYFKQAILCPKSSVLEKKCMEKGINVYTSSRRGNVDLRFSYKIFHICTLEKTKILHVHDSMALTLALFVIYLLPKVQLIYSRKRNNSIKNNFLKRWKYNHPRIRKIICVSKAVESIFYPLDIRKEKLQTIYDGIAIKKTSCPKSHTSLRKEYKLPKNAFIIGNIAALTKQKDLFTFISAAEIMLKQRSDLYFFIIGTGELKDDLIRYADQKKVSSHLFFVGFRSDARVLMKTFDLLLMSSQTEGIPLTIYEAFAEEIPVVTTNAGGIREVIINNETGFHTPVKDSQSLAKNALKVLNDKTLKCKLTDNALNLVHQKFTFEVMQKNYFHFYHSLMQKGDC